MLKRILSIAGKPGLYNLVSQGKNMLIVENIATKKRTPAYARDKVVSLGDISIYTVEDDMPLPEVLEKVKTVAEAKPVDVKVMSDQEVRDYFKTILPEYDEDRVYTTDIRKLFSWYNQLIAAGITEFKDNEIAEDQAAEAAEAAEAADNAQQA